MKQSLHPDVRKFKLFVKTNPHVLRDVKNEEKTLQDLFEEWLLFGEEDEIWETYRSKKKKEDMDDDEEEDEIDATADEEDSSKDKEGKSAKDLVALLKKMNFNDLQSHLTQFSGVLGSIQELLGQFRPPNQQPPSNPNQNQQNSPFSFRDD